MDEGHVIADSLGGVSNAYNITPQESTLNRHGDQAYMEKSIRDAGGCADFVAVITYPNTNTQIPSHYSYTYTINGHAVNDEFDNVNPDEVNAKLESNINNKNVAPKVNAPTPQTSNQEMTIYVTKSGKKYHLDGCSSLSNSKIPTTLSDAKAQGYGACKRCNPAQ